MRTCRLGVFEGVVRRLDQALGGGGGANDASAEDDGAAPAASQAPHRVKPRRRAKHRMHDLTAHHDHAAPGHRRPTRGGSSTCASGGSGRMSSSWTFAKSG